MSVLILLMDGSLVELAQRGAAVVFRVNGSAWRRTYAASLAIARKLMGHCTEASAVPLVLGDAGALAAA